MEGDGTVGVRRASWRLERGLSSALVSVSSGEELVSRTSALVSVSLGEELVSRTTATVSAMAAAPMRNMRRWVDILECC